MALRKTLRKQSIENFAMILLHVTTMGQNIIKQKFQVVWTSCFF